MVQNKIATKCFNVKWKAGEKVINPGFSLRQCPHPAEL